MNSTHVNFLEPASCHFLEDVFVLLFAAAATIVIVVVTTRINVEKEEFLLFFIPRAYIART